MPIFNANESNNPQVLINLSTIFVNTKQFELAIRYLEQAHNFAETQQNTNEAKLALRLLSKAKK